MNVTATDLMMGRDFNQSRGGNSTVTYQRGWGLLLLSPMLDVISASTIAVGFRVPPGLILMQAWGRVPHFKPYAIDTF